jgi:O-antigen biosynthesis protein WbqV
VGGILDQSSEYLGRAIHRSPVLGRVEDLTEVSQPLRARGEQPQRLIIASHRGTLEARMLELLNQANAWGLTVARLPSLVEFKDAVGDVADEHRIELRPIALEDLLERPQTPLNRAALEQLIVGQRILVTGAGGTIGSELTRQIAALRPADLTLADSSEFNLYKIDLEVRERHPDLSSRPVLCDIRDRERVMRLFAVHRPNLVFHAAALKHVPMVEINPGEGILTNVMGTRNVADAGVRYGALAMVQVSTDKAINPCSIMGASKRLAEFYCQSLDLSGQSNGAASTVSPRFMTVRFGNVLGSSGSVVPLFQHQLAHAGPLTVTHPEIRRYFMTVREAVELVLQASAHGIAHPAIASCRAGPNTYRPAPTAVNFPTTISSAPTCAGRACSRSTRSMTSTSCTCRHAAKASTTAPPPSLRPRCIAAGAARC